MQNIRGTESLNIHYVAAARYNTPFEELAGLFSTLKCNQLMYEPWPRGAAKPETAFKMFYGDDAVFINFKVQEKYFKATYKNINDPVYKDSCVEFFIGFEPDGAYYNFEFNALGTVLVGYGLGKERELPELSLVSSIKCISTIEEMADDVLPHHWEMTIIIPFTLFFKHQIITLNSVNCRGNFYKCGDELPEPHYLCWNNIIAAQPDFHLPAYFGELMFE